MTDQSRVTETIAFINNNPNFPVVRRAVAQFCRQTFPKLSLFDFGPYHTEFHALSGGMSVKQHATVPAGPRTRARCGPRSGDRRGQSVLSKRHAQVFDNHWPQRRRVEILPAGDRQRDAPDQRGAADPVIRW